MSGWREMSENNTTAHVMRARHDIPTDSTPSFPVSVKQFGDMSVHGGKLDRLTSDSHLGA